MIAKTIMEGSARYYPCNKCGLQHPSTTTILDVIGSPALMGWAAKNGTAKLKEYAKAVESIDISVHMKAYSQFESSFWKNGYEQAKEAADYGTIAHASFEMYLQGKEVDKNALPPPSRQAFEVFEKFANENKIETISTEKTYYNCQMGYAGTADWDGKINGKLTLADWKTSSGIFEKYIVQTWANAISDEIENGDRLYEQILIGRFGKDGSTDILILPRKGLENGFGGYEQSRVLIQACLPWFYFKKEWEMKFPYKRKEKK